MSKPRPISMIKKPMNIKQTSKSTYQMLKDKQKKQNEKRC